MPNPPEYIPPSHYVDIFDHRRWLFVGNDSERGYAWFEPMEDEMIDHLGKPPHPLPAKARRQRWAYASLIPCYES